MSNDLALRVLERKVRKLDERLSIVEGNLLIVMDAIESIKNDSVAEREHFIAWKAMFK